MGKYKGFYLYFDQRPLLEQVPAKDFKKFIFGLLDYAESGTEPEPLNGHAGAVQTFILAKLRQSKINSANGEKGAQATNNTYGARKIKENADGENAPTADDLKGNEKVKEINIGTEKGVTRPPPQEERKAFGRYKNVMLTDEERTALVSDYNIPTNYIDHFSEALQDKGYSYPNHYAALVEWWEKDRNQSRWQAAEQQGSFDVDDFFAAAVRRSLGDATPPEYRKKGDDA